MWPLNFGLAIYEAYYLEPLFKAISFISLYSDFKFMALIILSGLNAQWSQWKILIDLKGSCWRHFCVPGLIWRLSSSLNVFPIFKMGLELSQSTELFSECREVTKEHCLWEPAPALTEISRSCFIYCRESWARAEDQNDIYSRIYSKKRKPNIKTRWFCPFWVFIELERR